MTSQFTRRGMLLLSGTGVLGGKQLWKGKDSDFWNAKDPAQWSSEEIDRLITKSPWAKQVKASAPLPPGDVGYNPTIPGVGTGTGNGPGGGRTAGMGIPGLSIPGLGGRSGQNRDNGQMHFELIVRWESAKPVLEALKTPLAGIFANHCVIGMHGIPNAQVASGTQPSAFLEGKGLRPVKAAEIQQAPGSFTQSILFGFGSEALPLSSADHEVTFATRVAKYPISVKFNLKEMFYRGALAV